ncbi:PoNe immunity protein domain-containing protein [Psychromonas arctica]|uniref:PoNe immunity protein domain-containing protein n=1 Tax=Psychromonas arctica TaxID=168275 RepID=UPI002FD710BA
MLRDTIKNLTYFNTRVEKSVSNVNKWASRIIAEQYTSAQRLEAAYRCIEDVMYLIHQRYTRGDEVSDLKAELQALLSYRIQQKQCADALPLKEQKQRIGWEEIRKDHMGNLFLKWLSFAYCLDMGEVYYKQVLDLIANQGQDALLDEIAVQLGDTERSVSESLLYKTRFNKLYKVIKAAPDKRPKLMLAYLDAWYKLEGSPQFHVMTNDSYYGYWSWEAALVTKLYGIDDSLFIDHEYYPKDLVHWSEQ